MFCTRCGNELQNGDLFCGKCGTKVNVESEHGLTNTPLDGDGDLPETESACNEKNDNVASVSQHQRRLPGKGLRKDLKLPPKRRITRPLPLSINGACRYCGAKLSADAEHCPSCGANGPQRIGLMRTNQSVAISDVKRAGEIGQALGRESAALASTWDIWNYGGVWSFLILPFIFANPFFWGQWYYKSKARAALSAGNIDLAGELKDTSTKFAVAGWLLIAVLLLIAFWCIVN